MTVSTQFTLFLFSREPFPHRMVQSTFMVALSIPVKLLWKQHCPPPQQTHPEALFHGDSKHCQVSNEDQPSPE